MADQLLAGVDIGGTKTAIVLSSQVPNILTRSVFETKPMLGPEFAIDKIVKCLREALASADAAGRPLHAIGISCGGPLDPVAGIVQEPPNLPTWKDVPIKAILAREFGVKCYLENDANAGALAEWSFGAGVGARNLVFLTMGTGLGAGLILDGQLFRGTSNNAGEIGHVRLTRQGPTGYNKVGSVEGWASGAGMAKLARIKISQALARGRATTLAGSDGDLGSLTARDVAIAADAGDVLAQQIIRTTGKKLGEAMAILIDVVNPECIVVGGLAVRLKETLLKPARAVVKREALSGSADVCKIVCAALGENIGDVAALCVAVDGERREQAFAPESTL
jgi:glucokinase